MARVHLSTRIDEPVMARLDQQAARAGLTRSALAERLLEEGARMQEHPGIVFVDGPAGRRARVAGVGPDVWEVVQTLKDHKGSARAAAEYHERPRFLMEAAARYYAAFKDEIDDWIDENDRAYERFVEEARRRDAAFR